MRARRDFFRWVVWVTYEDFMLRSCALSFEDAAELLGLTATSLRECVDRGWLRPAFSKKKFTLYDAAELQRLWQRLKEDPDMAKRVKLKSPLHFSAVGVEPLAVPPKIAAKMIGMSTRRLKQLVDAGWIAPALIQGSFVLYDAADIRQLWFRLRQKGWPGGDS